MDGNPPIRYGISAAARPCPANAAATVSVPVTAARASAIVAEHLGEILVAAPAQCQERQARRAGRVLEEPGDGVCRLERGDDSLQAGKLVKRRDRLLVG